ncbi:MAE_28990/MAE_18760 family HEPN-like nuclease [Burkholderia gladioli]|uniref:MAE_28990/MAE_18760 family HEPN-like nuclease n=1 Tax=Burkholderia gladioli TaxID=28095 RepID=UPI001640B352|nr:MAE_28990/MAE_18760 family HEPN-like nuclease [Burkholderia gladioli]
MSDNLTAGFQERLAEVEAYLDFLSIMEAQAQQGPPRIEGAEHPISTQQQRILYSSVYLQLYNLVEATMSRCIEAVAAAAKDNARWKPSDLSSALRREWVRVTARTHVELTPEHRLESALLLCDHLVASLPINFFDIDKGGGGNWDDSEIEAFSKRIGFRLVVSQAVYSAIKRPFRDDLGPLALVKQLRNRLAHGSISFAQCAEDVTVGRLINLKDSTVNYLKEVVDCFTRYVDSFEYLLPEKRPV